jgi:hypothetical protein
VHNDAVFDDGDFANITHLGNSDKSTKVNKIGRFGVGVNVMYHISDVPAFVSRDRFVFFDPHAVFLPGVNPAMPGKSIFHLGDDKEVVAECVHASFAHCVIVTFCACTATCSRRSTRSASRPIPPSTALYSGHPKFPLSLVAA